MKWISKREKPPADAASFGSLIGDDEADALRGIVKPAAEFDYLCDFGIFRVGHGLRCGPVYIAFPGKTLLHINRDQRGNYAVIEVERF